MRHFYVRLVLGIVFVACLIFCLVTVNIPFALLFGALTGLYLYSAHSIWKKNKDHRG